MPPARLGSSKAAHAHADERPESEVASSMAQDELVARAARSCGTTRMPENLAWHAWDRGKNGWTGTSRTRWAHTATLAAVEVVVQVIVRRPRTRRHDGMGAESGDRCKDEAGMPCSLAVDMCAAGSQA